LRDTLGSLEASIRPAVDGDCCVWLAASTGGGDASRRAFVAS
jgi:hypothetical protein